MTDQNELMTEQEHRVMELTTELWQAFQGAAAHGSTRNADLSEVGRHIHALQHIILANAAARAYPDKYRLLGGQEMINFNTNTEGGYVTVGEHLPTCRKYDMGWLCDVECKAKVIPPSGERAKR